MSLGFSISDIKDLVRVAHKAFRNCQEAGREYLEIASYVKCLHASLSILREAATNPEPKSHSLNPESTEELFTAIEGCRAVLADLVDLLAKYTGLKVDSQATRWTKTFHRLGFASETEQLERIRGKLVGYCATISIIADALQIRSLKRIEAVSNSQYEILRQEIRSIAIKNRAEERRSATASSLSLSTFAEDKKTAWKDFRRVLVKNGFRSDSLEKYKPVLLVYMLKLAQSDILDQIDWWEQWKYSRTVESLADPQTTVNSISDTIIHPKRDMKNINQWVNDIDIEELDDSATTLNVSEPYRWDSRSTPPSPGKAPIEFGAKSEERVAEVNARNPKSLDQTKQEEESSDSTSSDQSFSSDDSKSRLGSSAQNISVPIVVSKKKSFEWGVVPLTNQAKYLPYL